VARSLYGICLFLLAQTTKSTTARHTSNTTSASAYFIYLFVAEVQHDSAASGKSTAVYTCSIPQ